MAEAEDMEAKLSSAMRERTSYFKEQADSLTLEGVRRLLEKDMGLKKCDLDLHKRFIKKCLEECFQSLNDKSVSSDHGEVETKDAGDVDETEIKENKEVLVEEEKMEPNSEVEQTKDDSANLPRNLETAPLKEISPSAKRKRDVSEDSVIRAVRKRASYFKEHAETITLVKVRRLLEEDLELDKYALDSFKSVIGRTLDEVLQSDNSEMDDQPSKKKSKKESNGRDQKPKANIVEESDGIERSTDSKSSIEHESEDEDEDEDDEEEEPGPKRKKAESKQKIGNSKKFRNGSKGEAEKSSSQKKRKKPLESDHEDNDESEEDEHPKGSTDMRRKEASTNVVGKRVQRLKSIIKACGINVPPSVYKRVKQASESERDHCLAMELEDILGREGLSANPSEKEIKAVKRSKERAKELEGIDMSNIISNTRRRSTSNFILPIPKPKEVVVSDSDKEGEDSEDEEDGDDDNDSNSEQSSEDVKHDGGDESD